MGDPFGRGIIRSTPKRSSLPLQNKIEENQAWKVLSDPSAEERHWIAACKVVRGTPACKKAESRHNGLSDRAHAWVTSLLGTFGGFGCFFFAFTALNQMTCALDISDELTTFARWFSNVLAIICWPAGACSLVGFMQRGNRPEVKHTWLLPLLVPVGLAIYSSIWRGDLSMLGLAVTGVAASRFSYQTGFVLSKWWRQLGSQSKLFAPYLWTVTSVGVFLILYLISFFSRPHDPHVQSTASAGLFGIQVLGGLSFATGLTAAIACRSRRLATQIAAALTIQLPTAAMLGYALIAGLGNGVLSVLSGQLDFAVFQVSLCALAIMILPSIGGAICACAGRAAQDRRNDS